MFNSYSPCLKSGPFSCHPGKDLMPQSTRTPSLSDPKISPDRYFTIKQMPCQTRQDTLNTAEVLGNNIINVKNDEQNILNSYNGPFLSCFMFPSCWVWMSNLSRESNFTKYVQLSNFNSQQSILTGCPKA